MTDKCIPFTSAQITDKSYNLELWFISLFSRMISRLMYVPTLEVCFPFSRCLYTNKVSEVDGAWTNISAIYCFIGHWTANGFSQGNK